MASTLLNPAMTLITDTRIRSAPTLETERLRLRAFRRDDLDALAAMLGDPVVTRFLGGVPESREQSWRKLMMAAGQWALLGIGYWAVEARADDRFVGQLGFGRFERGLDPDLADLPEMGWIFSSEVHGKGMAMEAGRAALQWLAQEYGPTPSWAVIAPENAASLKLADRLGFERRGDAIYHDEPIAIMKRA